MAIKEGAPMTGLPFAIGIFVGGLITYLWALRWRRDRDRWRERAEWLAEELGQTTRPIIQDVGSHPTNITWEDREPAYRSNMWLRAADEATRG